MTKDLHGTRKDADAIDQAIAAYTHELAAEAELGRADLEEIEDHLRALTTDLRDTGMPAAEAVTEAARRLGDPRAVAREHARVRGAFGAKLSMSRGYSAAALLVPVVAYSAFACVSDAGLLSRVCVETAFGAILIVALVMRLSWARPVLVGGLGFFMMPGILGGALLDPATAPWLVAELGALAFVAPWRRRELTPAGWALVLQVWSYCAASFALMFQYTTNDGSYLLIAPAATVAALAAVIATCGGILRARWSALASAISAATLVFAITELWGLRFAFDHAFFRVYIVGSVASGAVAAAISALLAWRTARSRLGSLQHVLR